MRHFFVVAAAVAITAIALGMHATASEACLIAASGGTLRALSRLLGATLCTVHLTAIAAAADQYLATAALAQIQTRARQQ